MRRSTNDLFRKPRRGQASLMIMLLALSAFPARTAENPAFQGLARSYAKEIQPLVKQYCLGCHSTEKQKGDLDLERFSSFSEITRHPSAWQTVVEQLSLGEMPPKEKPQPAPAERQRLLTWVNQALDEIAKTKAGDPGPVVLRRLNNAEYSYTLADLTGVPSLNPAKEFPVDSSAGEGFMNTGNSLVMSPALLTKYLDAAKAVAGHAILVPGGFRFSASTTRRDWTEEILAEIRALYRSYTDAQGGDKVNLQGVIFDTNEGGRLPVEKYLAATLAERAALQKGGSAFDQVARARGLNAKYLRSLWEVLNSPEPSLLLDGIRSRFRAAQPDDAAALTADIGQWQKALWKFSSVGHIGKVGGPKAWMEPVNPLVTTQDLRLKLNAPTNGGDVVFYLVANDAGDGNAGDFVVWEQPRLLLPGRAPLLLRDARDFIREMTARRERLFAATAHSLAAAADAVAAPNRFDIGDLARRHQVEPAVLTAWLNYLGIGASAVLNLSYFTNQIPSSGGYDFVKGWGTHETPHLVANSSDRHVRIPGNMKPHAVAVHPSPKLSAAVGWQSPMAGAVTIEGKVTHAHPECGNGVTWSLELRRGATRQRLANGVSQGSKEVKVGPIEKVNVQNGEMVSLLIGPRDGNHACDLTDIELVVKANEGEREWSLSRDVSTDILAANPHADRFGNLIVWHFYTEPVSGDSGPVVPGGSLLAKWQSAADPSEKRQLAERLEKLLLAGPPPPGETADAALYRQLASLGGPLVAGLREAASQRRNAPQTSAGSAPATMWALDRAAFGKHPDGSSLDGASLCVQAPSVVEIRLPADLVPEAEFAATGLLHPETGKEGSVQLQMTLNRPERVSGLVASEAKLLNRGGTWTTVNREVSHSRPILVNEGSAARKRIEAACEEFREWFPPALCYVKIVPVDEVVTLTLYHREDQHLARLMLDDAQTARLERLWDELHYVSQDALIMVDVLEQIYQYATQDADPKVFEPLRKPFAERAAAFRQRLVDTQPGQLDALLKFAGQAYRRPLSKGEEDELRALYQKLRDQEIPHEEAFRLTLARIFIAPAFLYRLERAAPGANPRPVSDAELANRLSYFLWSSQPDAALREVAEAGRLHEPAVLIAQTRRMLREPKVRRLATEFACAWLHIYDFDSLDEKSERHFPTFAPLRGAIYEEAILFFTDLFQNDGSVLEVFKADHTFLNEALARFYDIPGVNGPEWRRVEGVNRFGRGGVLGLGATLAKQSGASRTSPILRGNWVAEVLLGDKLPRPPKDVPRLPEDEATETLTVRQLVEKHTNDERCSGCHARIDGYGFALEGYDAIGRTRTRDLGDRPIDTRTKLFDGSAVEGAAGLREYLLTEKRDVVLQQFCRKLLGYALGRGIMLSDKPLIAEMQRALRDHQYRFSAAVETIVRSRQFREIRGIQMARDD